MLLHTILISSDYILDDVSGCPSVGHRTLCFNFSGQFTTTSISLGPVVSFSRMRMNPFPSGVTAMSCPLSKYGPSNSIRGCPALSAGLQRGLRIARPRDAFDLLVVFGDPFVTGGQGFRGTAITGSGETLGFCGAPFPQSVDATA